MRPGKIDPACKAIVRDVMDKIQARVAMTRSLDEAYDYLMHDASKTIRNLEAEGVVEKGASRFYLGYQSEDGEEPMLDTSPDALAFATRLPFLRG